MWKAVSPYRSVYVGLGTVLGFFLLLFSVLAGPSIRSMGIGSFLLALTVPSLLVGLLRRLRRPRTPQRGLWSYASAMTYGLPDSPPFRSLRDHQRAVRRIVALRLFGAEYIVRATGLPLRFVEAVLREMPDGEDEGGAGVGARLRPSGPRPLAGRGMTYDEALAAIHGLEGRPWRSGLDRMRAFVERAGLEPALSNKGYVHVAGTNGKGTTTAFVESILRHQGWRTGAFYSPYVVDYRERIQAFGELIPKGDLVALVERLLPVADSLADTPYGGATKFELEAAMGFAYWEAQGCDWVALETGLGGRLDATNVVEPKACVITSIGLDHTSILGDTLAEIAAEKAGIIKPGVPVIVGAMAPEAWDVIERVASEQGAPIWRYGNTVRIDGRGAWSNVSIPGGTFEGIQPPLFGGFSVQNAGLAIAACAAAGAIQDVSALRAGVRSAWLPGRFERRTVAGRELILDGAHNIDAALALANSLPKGAIHLVTNMLAGHEIEGFYRSFGDRVVGAEIAPIDAPRALAVDDAVRRLTGLGIPARGHASVLDAMDAALAADDGLVVVTGSNYLVGDALRLLA